MNAMKLWWQGGLLSAIAEELDSSPSSAYAGRVPQGLKFVYAAGSAESDLWKYCFTTK